MRERPHRMRGYGEEGFTLIEGMIATVLLATGLLGLASMQTIAMGRNGDANEKTRVTNFAVEIIERIQFNRRNALAYNGIDTSVVCTINTTTQPMARGDCDQWRNLLTGQLATGLQNLRGQVVVATVGPTLPPLNQNRVVVTMSWMGDAGEQKLATARSLSITAMVAPE
ncbi:type IV pilus modification PilV family protein [Nitrospira sp. CMX1]